MTKLESYMEDGAFTATMFYAEVDGRPEEAALARAFEELTFFSDHFEVLGVFAADPLCHQGFRLPAGAGVAAMLVTGRPASICCTRRRT